MSAMGVFAKVPFKQLTFRKRKQAPLADCADSEHLERNRDFATVTPKSESAPPSLDPRRPA